MNWDIIIKVPNLALKGKKYDNPAVKDHLRQEAKLRCTYCTVHENALGGIQAFHAEHYKPKSLKRFEHLEHELTNLYYACPVCNRFKGNTWPNDPAASHELAAYPDPSRVNYGSLFAVDKQTGLVEGRFMASKYMVQQLVFNRPQLILERRQHHLDQKLKDLTPTKIALMNQLMERNDKQSRAYLRQFIQMGEAIQELSLKAKSIPLYERSDVARPRT